MSGTHAELLGCGMSDAWSQPTLAANTLVWKERAYDAVETVSNASLQFDLLDLPSASEYRRTKTWTRTTAQDAFSVGEANRYGRHTYLDDRRELGTRVRLLCRTGALPVMERVGREQRPS